MTVSNLHWQQVGRQNYTSIQPDRSRYTIDRLVNTWIISYLPQGSAEHGRIKVPWADEKRSLTTAKYSCEVHALHALIMKGTAAQ